MSCKRTHELSCYDGWEDHDTITEKAGDRRTYYRTVAPCPECRPGRRAVWEKGLDRRPGWSMKDPEVARVWLEAEQAARGEHYTERPSYVAPAPKEPSTPWWDK